MTRAKVARVALVLLHRGAGTAAWLLRVRTAPGRWRPASNRHRYTESA